MDLIEFYDFLSIYQEDMYSSTILVSILNPELLTRRLTRYLPLLISNTPLLHHSIISAGMYGSFTPLWHTH